LCVPAYRHAVSRQCSCMKSWAKMTISINRCRINLKSTRSKSYWRLLSWLTTALEASVRPKVKGRLNRCTNLKRNRLQSKRKKSPVGRRLKLKW
jgi:hypothetical protein